MSKINKEKLVLVSICILLGIIISVQFKTAKSTTGDGVTLREREKELKSEYESVLEKKELLQDKLYDIDNEIKEYEEIEKQKNEGIKELYEELEKHQMFAGFESMRGSGLTIEINDPPFDLETKESIVFAHYDLILQLISKLNDLGAEAISINGERYTNYTSLEPYENTLKINDTKIYLPLKIKVIGNQEKLERGLSVKGNIMWNMQNKYFYDVKIKKKDNILIEEYNKPLKLEYAKPLDE